MTQWVAIVYGSMSQKIHRIILTDDDKPIDTFNAHKLGPGEIVRHMPFAVYKNYKNVKDLLRDLMLSP